MSDKTNLTDTQKNELIGGIANDIYRRATVPQALQLIQTQCTNQAKDIVEKATDEEIQGFLDQLEKGKQPVDAPDTSGESPTAEQPVADTETATSPSEESS
jgi:hypothetical protein